MRKKGVRKCYQSIGIGLGPWRWAPFLIINKQPSCIQCISVSVESTSKSWIGAQNFVRRSYKRTESLGDPSITERCFVT